MGAEKLDQQREEISSRGSRHFSRPKETEAGDASFFFGFGPPYPRLPPALASWRGPLYWDRPAPPVNCPHIRLHPTARLPPRPPLHRNPSARSLQYIFCKLRPRHTVDYSRLSASGVLVRLF